MTGVQGDRSGQVEQHRVLPVTDRLWTVPNLLSMIRLLLVPVFVWALLERQLGWAALVLVVAGASDFADGKIARRYGLTSRLGQVLDPIADRLYIAATVVGLAAVDVIGWWLVAVLFARETFIVLLYPVVRRYRLPIPEVTFIGKAATFNLLGGFPLLLLGQVDGWWTVVSLACGWALVWWGTVLYWITGLAHGWQVADMVRQRRRAGVVGG
ncbi:CDP-alcohol phosphatidyltransferase family protein [Serinicoccus kebangsaanensis]|uniref:CDP-alcohol phosphatidyltransferase family protein n=1 Tax=Serinicoccus kebangsaanensis TaxID=2602069 RepID=UPI00124D6500|nr:CDP-alcohol phosphatidyltransferase family protein [Serinicoccus kebangsaanensis]